MHIHGLSHVHGPQTINAPHRAAAAQPTQTSNYLTGADQLDISYEADLVSRVHELPDIREDRVAQIRAAIESGQYETDDKLEVAVGRLFDEIAG
ncbi:MAG: flagellar biosynthesis anti-sigma factor FlgM [Pirellulaceae bacterium]|nr:flagellar biosynthesis anti-sigma factor FlgM [Planctomycetales bacterium]MCA9163021.1 flagellar biosynthesis anti-sigma factor FlgM [Planctomycetales bacterium]MCA9207485.1 flagellar biosynthesis anti-sigma factor FlgM [Planctomycetales bacterium]MCA9222105.1 flagellar biosynthesis anti-sigma factor FlgM [Planctomycetales bacterium]MCA9227160.1 flagellar biosynthesis anti-sigma factor FlgM [Planctomycetales bacterium]